jgi:hypothetical protein
MIDGAGWAVASFLFSPICGGLLLLAFGPKERAKAPRCCRSKSLARAAIQLTLLGRTAPE